MPKRNHFLQDPKQALALIGKIIGGRKTAPEKKRTNLFRRIDRLIDEQLLDTLNEAGLEEEELAFSERLRLLSDKIEQLGKFELLEHKAIIGVGGQFSVGKSTFINSLIGKEPVLPQNISVTTSISTYIICGKKDQNSAYTTNHQFIKLADEEYKALTHEFTETYVGFSRFVDNIILERCDFSDNIVAASDTDRNGGLWGNIALLDTPGYNKARDGQQERFTDRKQAAEQLENVDFLIWLLSVENGDLSESDMDFLFESLGSKLSECPERVLVVINKAKKKDDTMMKEILEQVEETLRNAGISEKCLVTAYDSIAREERFGKTHIIDFLKKAASLGRNKKDLKDELQEIQKDIQKCLDERLKYEKSREKNYTEPLWKQNFRNMRVLWWILIIELY